MVTALAGPMPLNLSRSEIESLPRELRLLLTELSSSLPRSTADFFRVPELMSIASSSASLRVDIPFLISFSLGLSSTAQSVIFSDMTRHISGNKIRKRREHEKIKIELYFAGTSGSAGKGTSGVQDSDPLEKEKAKKKDPLRIPLKFIKLSCLFQTVNMFHY